ncbi:MAG TPA: hypothetical protein VLL98_01470 [Rickettsiales bacterium]|nr:hypothetical protein [Rickettsiales bacterium]
MLRDNKIYNIDSNQENQVLEFEYLNLEKCLYNIYQQGINNINIILLVSLETDYYERENLKKIILDLKRLSNNLVCSIDNKDIKFKVNKISLDVGDVLNRHIWTYRLIEKFLLENNLTKEEEISNNVIEKITIEAYKKGKQQGIDWFKNHATYAIDSILPNNKISTDFQLTDGITTIYDGDENTPKIEYICAKYWLDHPQYKTIENIINIIRNLPYSILEKTYEREARDFLKRLERRGKVQSFPELFVKYSKKYLAEETVEKPLLYQDAPNNLEFYYGKTDPDHIKVFKTKKAQKNKIIRSYLKDDLLRTLIQEQIAIKEIFYL